MFQRRRHKRKRETGMQENASGRAKSETAVGTGQEGGGRKQSNQRREFMHNAKRGSGGKGDAKRVDGEGARLRDHAQARE